MWYFKDGKPAIPKGTHRGSKKWIASMQEIEKKLADPEYKIVGRTEMWWGGTISTVWLGLDHNWFMQPKSKYKPLIFETIVFKPSGEGLDIRRYGTQEEARAGHKYFVRYWNNPLNLIAEWWTRRKYGRNS